MSKKLEGEIDVETGWIFSNKKRLFYDCTVDKGGLYYEMPMKRNIYQCMVRYRLKSYRFTYATHYDNGNGEYVCTVGPEHDFVQKTLVDIVYNNERKNVDPPLFHMNDRSSE